jgi:hypothetical protein
LLLNAGVSPSQASSIIQIKRSRIAAEVAGHRTETRTVRRRRVRRAPPRN